MSSPGSHEVSLFDGSGVDLPCVGTIISSYLILTVASCLYGNGNETGKNKLTVKTKSGNGQNSNSKLDVEQSRRIIRVIFHPDSKTDLVILVLDQELDVNILPILSFLNVNGAADESTLTTFSGHLCREDSGHSSLQISETTHCPFSSAFVCLLPLDSNAKSSSSKNAGSSCSRPFPGSSLICSDEERGEFLCGILATSLGNVGESGHIYTNITRHLKWIESVSQEVKAKSNAKNSSELNQEESNESSIESLLADNYDYEVVANFSGFGFEDPIRKIRSATYDVGAHIAHGMTVNKSDPIPYQLSIRYQNPQDGIWRHICGGIILDEETAITAAHCFDLSEDVSRFQVVAGESLLNTFDDEEQVLSLKEIIIHPEYTHFLHGNDIAILHVANRKFQFNKYVGGVWLSPFSNAMLTNMTAVISGWGKVSESSGLSNSLQKGDVSILPPEDCLDRLSNKMKNAKVRAGVVCALNPDTRTCKGDSGGPLVIQNYTLGNSTGNLLVGITSFGAVNCSHSNRVGVFTEISSFYNWIQEYRATPLGCGGFIEVNGEQEIVYKVPEELLGRKSVCIWVVASVNRTYTKIQILNNTTTQFQPAESQLFAIYSFGSRLFALNTKEILSPENERLIDHPFFVLYFRTRSSAPNSGFHMRLKESGREKSHHWSLKYLEVGLEDGTAEASPTREFKYPPSSTSEHAYNVFVIVKPATRHGQLKIDLKSLYTNERYEIIKTGLILILKRTPTLTRKLDT